MTVLSEFARTVATDFHIPSILDHLVKQIVAILPVDAAGVTLISDSLDPHYVAASDERALRYEKLQTTAGEGPCLTAYRSGHPLHTPDLFDEIRFPRFALPALHAGLRAVFSFPLRHEGQRLGALNLYRESTGPLPESMLAAAETMADVAAVYLISARSRVALQERSEELRQLAFHDQLTGLANRTLMLERLQYAFERSRRTGRHWAVLFVDLDGFKLINDRFGHAAGDDVLIGIADRLRSQLRPGDSVARLHGDEFLMLCEDLHSIDDARAVAARLTASLSEPLLIGGTLIRVTTSVGVAVADSSCSDPEEVFRNADEAMYQAKQAGGTGHMLFDPAHQRATAFPGLGDRDLPSALANGQLHNDYQAIVAIADAATVGFEALLRWHHPTLGPVPPTAFIPLAEASGLIDELDIWALNQACADHQQWRPLTPDRPERRTQIAVNLSAQQLNNGRLPTTVAATLEAHHMNPGDLILEITERVLASRSARAVRILNDLKDIGVTLALDDFGTGYSSLSYLQKFPLDIIKIDRSFVTDLAHGSAGRAITSAVVELAHALNMTVVAEGIETAEQYQQIRELKCDFGQGFHLARPVNATSVTDFFTHPGSPTPHDMQRPPRHITRRATHRRDPATHCP